MSDPTSAPSDAPSGAHSDGSGARRFAGNALWLLVSQVAGKAASFILVIILARGLGATDYGYFNFAISFLGVALILGTWGLEVAVVRELSRSRERLSELFSSGLVLRTTLGVGTLVLALALAPLFVKGRDPYLAVVIVGWALFFDELSGFLGAVFKAFERMRFHATVIVTNRIASTALAAIVVWRGGGLLLICGTYLLGSFGALSLGWWSLRRYFPPIHLRDASRGLAKDLFLKGAPLGVAAFLNMLVFRIDTVMLQAIKGPIAVGMYGIAYRFFESFLFVSWSLANVALPRMARADKPRDSARTFEVTVALMLAFYMPIAVGAPFAGEWTVTTVFGDEYAAAFHAVIWLTSAGVLYAVAYLARMASIAAGRRREIAWIAAGALLFNVVLNAIVIPRHGFVGAAAATCATEIIETLLLLGLFSRINGTLRVARIILVPIVASLAAAGVLLGTGARDLSAFIVTMVFYPAALAASGRLLAPDDARKALSLIRRRRSTKT